MIFCKNKKDERDISRLDTRLRVILSVYEFLAWTLYGDDVVITSIYRNDQSTHNSPPPYRFLDIGILEKGKEKGSRHIADVINVAFPYGKPGYITALVHGGTALHTHLQQKLGD